MNDNSIDYADNSLDILKTICAILIVGSHLLPLVPNTTFNELYGQWFFRFSVPVFFVASGYFFSGMQKKKRVKYIFRILVLYVVSMLLYSPFIIKEYIGGDIGKIQLLKYVLFGYGHLWYLIALCVSLVIWQIVSCFDCKKIFSDKFVIIIALMLLGIGAFFDEYYHLFDNSFIKRIGWRIDSICSTRSALFMGLPLVLIGRCIYYKQAFFMNKRKFLYLFLCVTFSLSLVETLFLTQWHRINIYPTCDVTFTNWIPGIVLFILSISSKPFFKVSKIASRNIRKAADVVYIVHPFIQNLLLYLVPQVRYILRFLIVLLISYSIAFVLHRLLNKVTHIKKR